MGDPILAYAHSYLDFTFGFLSKPWEDMMLQQKKRLDELEDSIMNMYDSLESSLSPQNKKQSSSQ